MKLAVGVVTTTGITEPLVTNYCDASRSVRREEVTGSIRTFVGIPITSIDTILSHLERLKLCKDLRVVRPETLHITLKFLGDTPRDSIASIVEAVMIEAAKTDAISLSLTGLDAFPNRSRPSVIWARCEPAEPLRELADAIDTALEQLGFAREGREFRPHLTLALQRSRKQPVSDRVRDLLDQNASANFGVVDLNEAVLFQSILSPDGPTYRRIANFPFGSSARGE